MLVFKRTRQVMLIEAQTVPLAGCGLGFCLRQKRPKLCDACNLLVVRLLTEAAR